MRLTQIEKRVKREKIRLSVQYTLITLVIVVLLMVSFYLIYSRSIYDNFDASISQRATSIANVLSTKEELNPEALKSTNLSQSLFQTSNEIIEISDAKGTILFSSSDVTPANIPIKPQSFSSGTYPEEVNNKTTLVKIRAYTAVVTQRPYYVTVARTYDDIHDAFGSIIASFLIMIPFVVAVTGFASFKLASLAITPIEESYRELKRFTEDASHELKTPLAAIKANIDVALSKNIDETQYYREKLSVINESVDRMVSITESMLYLSKLDSHGIEAKRDKVDINALLDDIRERFADAAQKRNVEVEVTEGESTVLETNKEALDEIVSIIVENAVKFNKQEGHVRIAANATRNDVGISIADTGIGIAREDLPHIFDRFYRGEKSRSRETGGAGLGLSIAYNLATVIGARIGVESQEGLGSTFTITIERR
jgi:signal transduction histidine kinase